MTATHFSLWRSATNYLRLIGRYDGWIAVFLDGLVTARNKKMGAGSAEHGPGYLKFGSRKGSGQPLRYIWRSGSNEGA